MTSRQELREWVYNNIIIESVISKDDIDKMIKVGKATARDVFDDEYDDAKAEQTIRGIIEKGIKKGMTPEDISGWIQSSFRDEE